MMNHLITMTDIASFFVKLGFVFAKFMLIMSSLSGIFVLANIVG